MTAPQLADKWKILALPAISEDGKALWPEKYPIEALTRIRNTIGTRNFAALYQQTPIPDGGGEFKRDWCKYYQSHDGGGTTRYLLVDPAGAKGKTSDYTAIWVVGLGPDSNYYILDILRDRLNLTERANALFRLHKKWKPYEVRYESFGMQGDIEHIQYRQEHENYRFEIVPVGDSTKKETRIRRLVPLFESKRVWFPLKHHYTDTDGITRDMVHVFLEEELAAFPAGAHDDMLDALARIAEPDLYLSWPQQEEAEPEDRYSRHRGRDAGPWAR